MKNNNNSNLHLPDWQQGEHSKMHPLERIAEMQKWLKKNKKEILLKLVQGAGEEDEPVGFVDL